MDIRDHVSILWNRKSNSFQFYTPPRGLSDGFRDEEMALAAICERLESDPNWVKLLCAEGECAMEKALTNN